MMTFILATGYLFTVYLLLALAKRTGKKTVLKDVLSDTKSTLDPKISLNSKVTEAVNSR